MKALLFHTAQCDVNVANELGDTPLHNAARWGYGKPSACSPCLSDVRVSMSVSKLVCVMSGVTVVSYVKVGYYLKCL